MYQLFIMLRSTWTLVYGAMEDSGFRRCILELHFGLCLHLRVCCARLRDAYCGSLTFDRPFAGIMISDYYLVKRGAYDVPALYDPKGICELPAAVSRSKTLINPPDRYNKGVNWRAAVTLACAIGPTLYLLSSSRVNMVLILH